eukprot:4995930-Lingulodinium_polyedra.AAC.1
MLYSPIKEDVCFLGQSKSRLSQVMVGSRAAHEHELRLSKTAALRISVSWRTAQHIGSKLVP